MTYEIKDTTKVETGKGTKIRVTVKIGELEFYFTSNTIKMNSKENYFNFYCSDPLLPGACKVLGIEKETIMDKVKEAALPMFHNLVEEINKEEIEKKLAWWKELPYWDFIKTFKEEIPPECDVTHITYEEGVDLIKEGRSFIDEFPDISIKTPYSNIPLTISREEARSNRGWNSSHAYYYYEITAGYDDKFGRPRKLETMTKKVLEAITILKARNERTKKELRKREEIKRETLNELGDMFEVKEERKYSAYSYRGKRNSWIETSYHSENLKALKHTDGSFGVVIKGTFTSEQINKLNDFLNTL